MSMKNQKKIPEKALIISTLITEVNYYFVRDEDA